MVRVQYKLESGCEKKKEERKRGIEAKMKGQKWGGKGLTREWMNEWMNGQGQGVTEVIVPDFCGFCGWKTVHFYWGKWYRTVLCRGLDIIWLLNLVHPITPLLGDMEPILFYRLGSYWLEGWLELNLEVNLFSSESWAEWGSLGGQWGEGDGIVDPQWAAATAWKIYVPSMSVEF